MIGSNPGLSVGSVTRYAGPKPSKAYTDRVGNKLPTLRGRFKTPDVGWVTRYVPAKLSTAPTDPTGNRLPTSRGLK